MLFSFQIIYNKCRNFIQICSIEIYEHLNKCRKGNVISKKKKKKTSYYERNKSIMEMDRMHLGE